MSDDYISVADLWAQLSTDQPPTVIDVRGHDEYLAGHIPGALLIPSDVLAETLNEIRHDRPVVTF